MKDLRVNSKTKINEFKRKHNWLVESSAIKLNVSNIKSLSNEDIENLSCGDIVLKEDESGKHAYLVSFKNETGMCLTYVDASVIETQSYDKVGENWVYNSEDKTPNLLEVAEKSDIKPIYFHPIILIKGQVSALATYARLTMIVLDNKSTPYTLGELFDKIRSIPDARFKADGIDVNSQQPLYLYRNNFSETVEIVHATTSATNLTRQQFITYFDDISDPVNKIN